MKIDAWLRELGLQRYESLFAQNAIETDVLPELTEGDLEKLGIPLGDRKRILKAIRSLPTVSTAIGATAAVRAQSPPPGAERRHLSVLICDLVGSTALSARLDPEDMGAVMNAYHAACSRIVQAYDGFLVDFRGDGILAYFGYPRAHGDDAERTVRAGLDLIAAVGELDTPAGEPLSVRVGIATGLVVVGDLSGAGRLREHAVIGEAPNIAARLQNLAEPGSVVIAASTRKLLGDVFRLRDLGEQDVKGIADPVGAWLVEGISPSESRFEAVRVSGLIDFVGREREMDQLLEWQRLAWKGQGQVVLISGESGIGKSRLAAALTERINGEKYTRLRYQCSPYHANSALHPVISQLARAADFKKDDTHDERLDKLQAALRVEPAHAETVVPLFAALLSIPSGQRYPALSLSPVQQRRRTLAALLDGFEQIARRQPVLLLFEDVHWSDATSLELLDLAVERIRQLAVLALLTFHPDFEARWIGLPHVRTLPLLRLSRTEVESMVSRVTGSRPIPGEVMSLITAKTDGNPLYVEELTKALLEMGIMVAEPDGYRLDGPLPPLAIPATLQDSLMARLDRLGPVKEIAQIGAAIGREFTFALLQAVIGRDEGSLSAALSQLEQAELVFRRGEPPDALYNFKHALVRDAAYQSLLKSRRHQLHGQIARTLESRFPDLASTQPEIVAHHFTEAGLVELAIEYWLKAGKLSLSRSANAEAVKHLHKGVELTQSLPPSADVVRKALLDARAYFEQALDVLKSRPESRTTLEQAFDIHVELRAVLRQLGEVRPMLEHLRAAEALAQQLGDDRRRGRACALMTTVLSTLDELDEAVATGRRAVQIATAAGDSKLRIVATSCLEHAHYYRGEYEQVVDIATENLAALPNESALEYFGMAIPPSIFTRGWMVMSLVELGRFSEAARYAAELIRLTEPSDQVHTLAWSHLTASMPHLFKGEWTTAYSLIEQWLNMQRGLDVAVLLPWAISSSAWVLAQIGKADEALSRVGEAEQVLKGQAEKGIVGHRSSSYYAIGRACLLLGRLDQARELGFRAIESSQRQPGFRAHALHLLGDLAAHPDQLDADAASTHYQEALALAQSHGMRPLTAHCYVGLSKLGRLTGKSEQARKHWTAGTAIYRELGMDYWLELAEQLAAVA